MKQRPLSQEKINTFFYFWKKKGRAVCSLWQRLGARNQSTLSLSLWMTIKAGAIWPVYNKNQELSFLLILFFLLTFCLIVYRSITSAGTCTRYKGGMLNVDWFRHVPSNEHWKSEGQKRRKKRDKERQIVVNDTSIQRGWYWTMNMHINKNRGLETDNSGNWGKQKWWFH